MLSEILPRLASDPVFCEARDALRQGKRTALYDMTQTQRLLFALAMARQRPVIYLLPNERAARQAYEDALGLQAQDVVYFQQTDLRFMRAVTGLESQWQQITTLSLLITGKGRLMICAIDALQTHMPPKEWFADAMRAIKIGDTHMPEDLARDFARLGYERVDLVEGKGQFALRGDILDIYPPAMDMPARIELFDVQVDSIRLFDPLTQRSAQRVDQVLMTPASMHVIPEPQREQAAKRLRTLLEKTDLSPTHHAVMDGDMVLPDPGEVLETGMTLHPELWAHALYPEDSSLLSYLPDAWLVIDTPERAMQRLADHAEGFVEEYHNALENRLAHPAQAGLIRSQEEMLTLLGQRTICTVQDLLRGMGNLTPQAVMAFPGQRIDSYRGRIEALAEDVTAWQAEGLFTVLFTGGQTRSERLAAALAARGISAAMSEETEGDRRLLLHPGNIHEGALIRGANLALIAPHELFGASRTKARKPQTAGQRIEAFTDLSIGDYVVHDHHGIGVYQGTVRLQSEGIWRDYLFIQYRGSDKLYIPADQFDRVQKYIGSPDTAPPLNDLSSNTWSRQKSRVKLGLKQLAFDLVELYASRQATPGYAFEPFEPFESQFADMFDHELTLDQEQAVNEVLKDMERPQNMDRLLCGDVGYGKTEVAMRAAFRAVMNGKQVAFLAPTTILVQQHVRTLQKRFEGFPVRIDFVSRFRSPRENRETLQKAREGSIDILVGTHRLLSRDVAFKNLGLLIIDEEQRFGVRHKEQIQNLKSTVDVLTLSATPIPRTLHMSMVGVRDMSLLGTPPEDRFPVSTYVVDYRDGLIRDAIMRELNREGQVFFLYNRVSDMDRMAAHLRQLVPEARIAVAHGQMPENVLEDVMHEFYLARHDVLLCSTIIENGLDIQNANTLIVYDADRFGLSQLYQLRGRVGRSNQAAFAFFTVRPDKALSETAEKRLSAIKEFTAFGAGFRIAMRDLEIRGAGNIFGPEQSGQVAVVGYEMYVRMIEEAIREAQGDFSGLRDSELETRVDILVNAFLPEDYVRGEGQRIEIYKRIAMIRSQQDEMELVDDLIDRFGEPEEPVINLIHIARLRALANALGVDQVKLDRGELLLRFHPQYAVDPMALYQALSQVKSGMALQAGKRYTTLLVAVGKKDSIAAVKAGIAALERLMELMAEAEKTPVG
ncbi:MAG: transcription-repair coupling factor [Clostridiales bacterium]|nr:transcription-repair coupling factor [Clostridiales bacterium]